MDLRLLVSLKTRLVARSFARRGRLGGFASLLVLAIGLAPIWTGGAVVAHKAVVQFGADGVVAVFALVQVTWIYMALILGAFSEAFDLRRMLRYPINPRAVYLMNVLATPFDIVAILMMPALAATVVAAGTRMGGGAAAGTALAVLLLVLITSALLQVVLALLGDLLKHEWARAAGGLFIGVALFAASWVLRSSLAPTSGEDAFGDAVVGIATRARWFASASMPSWIAGAALVGDWPSALVSTAGSAVLFAALVRFGAPLALAAAMDRETRATAVASSRASSGAGRGARLLDALLPADLAVLVGREMRTFVRTPQILIGLVTTPLLVAFFFSANGSGMGVPRSVYWAAFLTLMPALNLSANQFGLDREGVRTFFILPLDPRRLLLAKNLSIVLLIAGEAVVTAVILVVLGLPGNIAEALTALAGMIAVLPAILTVGNVLSIRSPWRMTFRIGGAPRGAIGSAFAQIAVVGAMALFLAAPIVLSRVFWTDTRVSPALVALVAVTIVGAAAWLAWHHLLDGAARSLVRRKEQLIDALARPEETG